jgi:hypothetical protein
MPQTSRQLAQRTPQNFLMFSFFFLFPPKCGSRHTLSIPEMQLLLRGTVHISRPLPRILLQQLRDLRHLFRRQLYVPGSQILQSAFRVPEAAPHGTIHDEYVWVKGNPNERGVQVEKKKLTRIREAARRGRRGRPPMRYKAGRA